MSSNTRQFLAFIAFAVVWSLTIGLALGQRAPPLLAGVIWLAGFLFGTYVIINGKAQGFGYFLAVWLTPFAVAAVIAGIIALDRY